MTIADNQREPFVFEAGPLKGLRCKLVPGRVRRYVVLVEILGPRRVGEEVYVEIKHLPRTVWQQP